MPYNIKEITESNLPVAIATTLNIIAIMDIMTVNVQAHDLAFSRPRATTRLAIPNITRNIPMPNNNSMIPLIIDKIPPIIIKTAIIVTPNGRLVCMSIASI